MFVGEFPLEPDHDTYVNQSQIPQQLPAVAQNSSFTPYNGSDGNAHYKPPNFSPPMPVKPKYVCMPL